MRTKDEKKRKMGPEFQGYREAYNNVPREWLGTEPNRLLHKVLDTQALFSMTKDDSHRVVIQSFKDHSYMFEKNLSAMPRHTPTRIAV